MEYCHSNKVAHRDLKLDNTLLDDHDPPRIKLCDFGFAKNWSEEAHMFTQVRRAACWQAGGLVWCLRHAGLARAVLPGHCQLWPVAAGPGLEAGCLRVCRSASSAAVAASTHIRP